jgi:hypothetical protein
MAEGGVAGSMNTLEDAKEYFQDKGYSAEICTFNFEAIETKLMIRGRRQSITLFGQEMLIFRRALFIVELVDKWQIENPYPRENPIVETLRDAVFLAEDLLGPPIEEQA